MASRSAHDPLRRLAEEAGLLVEYEDALGARRTVAPDALRAILAALGLPSETREQAEDSRRALARTRALERTGFVTAEVGRSFPVEVADGPGLLTMEGGAVRDVTIRDGRAPPVDEPGYHRLRTAGGEAAVAVCPARAFGLGDALGGRRGWGPGVQVYALRDARAEPLGDFGALARFAAAAGGEGAQALAISPVHALFAADPSRFSPYGPSSRLFLNGLYADPRVVFGDAWPEAGDRGGDLVDYAAALPAKLRRLRALFETFCGEAQGARRADFERFRAAGGTDLEAHARFEALHARFFAADGARGWREWPARHHDPRGPATAEFAAAHADEVSFHVFLQWLAARSLTAAQDAARRSGMAIGLIADLAVGMDPGGSHVWSRREDVIDAVTIGAPPDRFQAKGQDWGLAAFSPSALRRSGYHAFIATLRAAMRHAGGVRIDHVLGLRRLWLVPRGGAPADGAYLRYPLTDLLRLTALESHRAQAVVVGEDLGTVPAGFRDRLEEAGVAGMRVLWFERTKDGVGFTPPSAQAADAAAMTTTHDLPTVAGWWSEHDLDLAAALGEDPSERRAIRARERTALWRAAARVGAAQGPEPPADAPGAAVDAALSFVAGAPCRLMIAPVEDLIGAVEQPNLPGTVEEHPNWRRRLPADADVLFADPDVRRRIARIAAERER